MPHETIESAFFTSLEPLQRGLASGSDKRTWLKACVAFEKTMAATEALAYPKRHDEAVRLLEEAGMPMDPRSYDQVIAQCLEEPRHRLRDNLIHEARLRFNEATLPSVRALFPRVLERLQDEIDKLDAAERAAAERWRIPYEPSMTLKSLRATHRHHTENPLPYTYAGDRVRDGFLPWLREGEKLE